MINIIAARRLQGLCVRIIHLEYADSELRVLDDHAMQFIFQKNQCHPLPKKNEQVGTKILETNMKHRGLLVAVQKRLPNFFLLCSELFKNQFRKVLEKNMFYTCTDY